MNKGVLRNDAINNVYTQILQIYRLVQNIIQTMVDQNDYGEQQSMISPGLDVFTRLE